MDQVGYKYRPLRLTLADPSIIDLIRGAHLYTDRWIGVSELIQNAIDACRIRQELTTRDETSKDKYQPEIVVILDPENGTASIKDNGVGMTTDIIHDYLLTVGRSYYSSSEFAAQRFNFKPIGRLGMGFLSSFSLSDKVVVKTRHINQHQRLDLELRKDHNFASLKTVEDNLFEGTEIILDYNQFLFAIGDEIELKKFLQSHFNSDEINLLIKLKYTKEIKVIGTLGDDLDINPKDLNTSIRRMRLNSDIQPFLNLVKSCMRTLSNRDLVAFNEKHIKAMLVALFQAGGFYVVNSEEETENGYIDILLTKSVHYQESINYEWLIELKYIKVQDRKRLQQVRKDGLLQLKKYAESDKISRSYVNQRLQKVLLTFIGKDELYVDWLDGDSPTGIDRSTAT